SSDLLEGEELTIDDRIDAVTTTGTLELDFTNDTIPSGGIVAKTEDGPIELSLPNLEIAQENMTAEAKEGDGETDEVEDFFYRINAKSNDGSVDLASDLDRYDAAKNPQEAKARRWFRSRPQPTLVWSRSTRTELRPAHGRARRRVHPCGV